MSSSIPSPCLPYRPSSRLRPVPISYRIPDNTATQSITCDTGYDDIRFARPSPRLISLPYCFPPRFPPHHVARRVGSRRDAIRFATRSLVLPAYSSRSISSPHLIGSSVPPVACFAPPHAANPSHPSHPSHPLRSISLAHRPAPSDETSDKQAKRRTRRAIDNSEAERHDIRHLPDTANTHPRQPYSLYKPHNARTLPRTRPR